MTSEETGPAPEATQPPPDPALDAFEQVCITLSGFAPELSPEFADGYLAAIAASRRHIGIDEWLPALAGDAFERAFADPDDEARARAVLEARAATLRADLEPQRLLDRGLDELFLAPLMQVWDDETRADLVREGMSEADVATLQTGAEWVEGFFTALDAFEADWPEPTDDDADGQAYVAMLETLQALLLEPGSQAYLDYCAKAWKEVVPTRDELIDEACFAVQELRVYWLERAPRTEPRRVQAMPGRNDPCFCGSGRKFKKCHGA